MNLTPRHLPRNDDDGAGLAGGDDDFLRARWSMWMRTGMRCARRTQVKIGLTLARPWALSSALVSAMRAADALDVAGDFGPPAHEADVGVVALVDVGQLRFLEVADDPEGIAVDHGELRLAGRGVVADAQREVGDVAVDGRADDAAVEIDLGLVARGDGGLVGGLRDVGGALRGLPFLGGDGLAPSFCAALGVLAARPAGRTGGSARWPRPG